MSYLDRLKAALVLEKRGTPPATEATEAPFVAFVATTPPLFHRTKGPETNGEERANLPDESLSDTQAVPSTADKDYFRVIVPGARIAKYAGADAEDRKAKVLAQFAEQPGIRRAMAFSEDGTVTVGVRSDGAIWTQDLTIPAEKFDPFLILERFEKATLQ